MLHLSIIQLNFSRIFTQYYEIPVPFLPWNTTIQNQARFQHSWTVLKLVYL